ncbi:MAG TPA: SurA N-terminal domain-containing protein, partial [Gammaproteobacteria bacterium]|nr:SurA N-terminal domain-containing protein [Gammaproteobacteria bacterium]
MNKWLHAGFILLCGLFLSLSVNAATNKQSLDRIAVILNDTVITQTDLDQAMETIKKQLSASNTPIPPAIVLRKQVLDQLINRKLQLQLAEQSDVTVSDAQITAAINNIAKTNNITADQLYEAVLKQGLTRKDYRKEIHDEILIQEIQQQAVGGKITLQPQEVDDFMRGSAWQAYNTKEYHLEDILIALPETPTPEDIANAKKRAETVLAKLRGGMSFKEAAVSESGDSNALQGGDLGWRKLPEIPSAFAETLTQKKEKD